MDTIDYKDLGLFDQSFTQFSVSALESTQRAYDFYDALGWRTLNGDNMKLCLVIGEKAALNNTIVGSFIPTLKDAEHAGVLPGNTIFDLDKDGFTIANDAIIIGEVDNAPLTGHGILGHEYTHGVISHKCRLSSNVESTTVNEGYADVMGSLIAGDWEFFPHEVPESWSKYDKAARSAVDPHKYVLPAAVGDKYFKPFVSTDESGKTVYADEHDNTTIVSHTAYLMSQKGLSDSEIAELFYNSMNNLTSNTNFSQTALALMISADTLSFSKAGGAVQKENKQ